VNRPDSPSTGAPQDVLRDEILADSRRQATRLIRRAQRDAQAMLEKAEADVQVERERKIAVARTQADQQHRLALATVPVEINRLRARRVERELSALRGNIRARLLERRDYAYGQMLEVLATEAIERMEGTSFVLELPEEDLPAFSATLPSAVRARLKRPHLKIEVAAAAVPMVAGVLVRDESGRQIWDNGLESRLQRMWPALRSLIAERLGLTDNTEPSGASS
jgi:vacuolar-type H+-ATPase subunit E/Vma4